MLCPLGALFRLMTALLAPSPASNSSLRPATGNPQQPHTEPPLKANESFIMILLFSLWLLKLWQPRSLCPSVFHSLRVRATCVKPDVPTCAACMKGYLTYTHDVHTHTHARTLTFLQEALVPHFIDPLCFFS